MDLTPLIVSFLTFYGIYLILALSLNLEYGFTGLPNFGKVFFYSVGAYVTGAFVARALTWAAGSGLPVCEAAAAVVREQFAAEHAWIMGGLFVVTLVLAALVGGAFGYALSYPALRVRDVYLAMVLLVVAEISRVFVRANYGIICGPHGLGGIPNPLAWVSDPGWRSIAYTLLVLGVAGLCYALVERLTNSPYGRMLKALRDDELAAGVLGKRVVVMQSQVMAIGSAMAAVAGSLYTFFTQFVGTTDFIPLVTFNVLAMVILGGAASNRGVALGVLVMTALDRFTRASFLSLFGVSLPFDVNYLRYAVIGLLLVVLIMYRPRGLFPERPVQTPAQEVLRRSGTA